MAGKKKAKYDLIIIGGGVAGLSAAMYGARLGMETLCLGASGGSEKALGGTISESKSVENWPGISSISGGDLSESLRKHAEGYKKAVLKEERAIDIKKTGEYFEVSTEEGKYSGKTILFATGTKIKKLEVPGAKELEHRGITYCAMCDAPLFKEKIVAVVGGSNSAVTNALIVSEYAKKVFIIYRGGKLSAEEALVNKLKGNKKVEILLETNVVAVKGNKKVEEIEINKKENNSSSMKVDGIFVAIGREPASELAEKIGTKVNDKKEIVIDHQNMLSSVEGVYAAGDVADNLFKQAILGASQGCIAAYAAFNYLNKKG